MRERIQPIIAKDAVPVETGGTMINGTIFSPIAHDRISELIEVSENFNTCACHMEGGMMVCACPEGKSPEPIHNTSNEPDKIPLGKVVKDPVVAVTLLEEAALHSATRLEKLGVSRLDVDNHLNTLVRQIDDVATRLSSSETMNRARHEAMGLIKTTKLPATIIAATIFAAQNS